MKLSDQLYELRHNILRDFSTQVAGNTDSLWTDETLISYIADAEKRFCRQTLILRDADTPNVVQVNLVADENRYMLHPSVLCVISARYNDDDYDLQRIGRTLMNDVAPVDPPFFDPAQYAVLQPGRPIAYSTDELLTYQLRSRTALVTYPTITADQADTKLHLRVARLPLRSYSVEDCDLDRDSEIPDDYILDLLEWAAHRALRNHDADAGDPQAAAAHKAAFEEAVEKIKSELRNRLLATISWKFGSNAFSWTR